MINYSNATFIKSLTDVNEKPSGFFPEVLIVGKSNVGKSSLINALCQKQRLAFTSSKPGHTKLLNYFDIDHKFYLVDAPGYGYAKGGVDLDRLFGEMMENYFANNEQLKLVLILIDSRREFNDNDLEILHFCQQENIPYFIVITKMDKINQKEKSLLTKRLKALEIEAANIYFTSSLETKSLHILRSAIEKAL
jgi:GTP-binding protein